jgi:hypothetical protein
MEVRGFDFSLPVDASTVGFIAKQTFSSLKVEAQLADISFSFP